MPSGKTHNKINQSLLITVTIIAIFYPDSPVNLWWLILGLAIGINYLGPDLDTNNTMQDQNWGIYGFYWNIYSRWMPHRGTSHSLLGILTRLLFLLPLAFLLFVVSQAASWYESGIDPGQFMGLFFQSLGSFVKTKMEPVAFVLFGIVIADILHIGEDMLFVGSK